MSNVDRGLVRARRERLQVHWEVPGLAASVYNTKRGTRYKTLKGNGGWSCDCVFGRNFARFDNVCKHIVATMRKELDEGYFMEGRSSEQAIQVAKLYERMLS